MWLVNITHPLLSDYDARDGYAMYKRADVYRNIVGHTWMECDRVHGGVVRKYGQQKQIADLKSLMHVVDTSNPRNPHNTHLFDFGLQFDWKRFLSQRYASSRMLRARVRSMRWVNVGCGPDWRDATGQTIVSHPNEIWLRTTLEHTEEPLRINVCKWTSPSGEYPQAHRGAPNPVASWLAAGDASRRRALSQNATSRVPGTNRLRLDRVKRKDLHEVGRVLVGTTLDTIDEYGDPMHPSNGRAHCVEGDKYPFSDGEEESGSESDNSTDSE